MSETKHIYVGLSGGVDSSVAAARLLKAGHRVTGVFIKVWQPPFYDCNWEKERLDAMRVAAHLGIPFTTFDAEEAYKQEVVDYLVREYQAGRTPNPDVMCNQYVKFGVFLEHALREGADAVATGHYAQNINGELHRGVDTGKDQSYFLWTLTKEQLRHIYFPVGDTEKTAIRAEAEALGLPTAQKKDSQGICFLGDVRIEDFMEHFGELTEGPVLNTAGETIGTHKGALVYTIGQRHGFTIHNQTTTQVPHYVVKKDVTNNTVTVSHEKPVLSDGEVSLASVNELSPWSEVTGLTAQFRYRQQPFAVSVTQPEGERAMLKVLESTDAPAVGQSCVLYDQNRCLGGGIIDHS